VGRRPDRLPDHLQALYDERRQAIRRRLQDFASVPSERYFYEACFCVCTPQSKAASANVVVMRLEEARFLERGGDPSPLLRSAEHYIRFHTTKSGRLLRLREEWGSLLDLIRSTPDSSVLRDTLVERIDGYGLKEASHFLRNIGRRDLAIIDRHLLRNLVDCGLYMEIPNVSTRKRYLGVEGEFRRFSDRIGIPMDELDLLFWSAITGEILK